jgi:predicted nucleic acid-binding protein
LETEAKLRVQDEIQKGKHELIWSYILEYENSVNPYEDRRSSTLKWKDIASLKCTQNDSVVLRAQGFEVLGVRQKDALHLSCAIEMQADYFLTTDQGILNKAIDAIAVINPVDFVRMEAQQ